VKPAKDVPFLGLIGVQHLAIGVKGAKIHTMAEIEIVQPNRQKT